MSRRFCFRSQNCPYFAHARAVKKKIWKEAENGQRDWGWGWACKTCKACAFRVRKTLTPSSIDFFTDFEKKPDCFAV